MTLRDWSTSLHNRQISSVELVTSTIAEIKKRDIYCSLITLTEEEALREAAERDKELARGIDRGPFHGVPIAYKDLFYTRGIRTTAGSLLYRDFIPAYDATAVERLRAAGAICVGKTNMHELAYGITSKNPHYGFVLNPHDTGRIAGGSSGGSATLIAANLLPMCLGTDTGGSIRIPASYCGVVGLKPTYGRVSRFGVHPLSFSLDHVGPLGSCVDDCALAANVLAGPDNRDPTCLPFPSPDFNRPVLPNLNGIRVGVPRNFFFDRISEDVSRAVHNAIGAMEHVGAAIHPIDLPDLHAINATARVVQLSETAALYGDQKDASLFGGDLWSLIQQGKLIAAHEYVNAQRLRTLFRSDFDRVWEQVDVLATPTTPVVAPRLEENTVTIGEAEEDTRLASTRLVRAINFLGEPALSMPCGKTGDALPIGLQLISSPWTEPLLLQIARTLEAQLSAVL